MNILKCIGYELEKEKSNSPEDYFTRSSVTYKQNGKIKEFQIIYIRYFEEVLLGQEEVMVRVEELLTDYTLKDIVALLFLLQNPSYQERKRVYINSETVFMQVFENSSFVQVKEILNKIAKNPID